MKRAIAMKCNQEQWDSIKDKLVGLDANCITGFNKCKYLVNNLGGCEILISNCLTGDRFSYNRELHETWNEQIFLEACGIETEKIFKGSELQCRNKNGKWYICTVYEYRLKPDYSKEIEELERQIEILKNK